MKEPKNKYGKRFYFPSRKRFLIRFKEKGGTEKELPVHHKQEELLDASTNTSEQPTSAASPVPSCYRPP
jgi:hypothetical protein